METVTRFAERHPGPAPVGTPAVPDAMRALPVSATYLLSEDGRKASLLAGGNGHAVQQITLQVPTSRLHLVAVDRQGVARLKLRPRFELDGEQGIVRIDSAPRYDAPPSIEDLFRAAAKNLELESAYLTQQTSRKAKRHETETDLRERVANAFLGDKDQRAVSHPPPTPKQCYIVTERGRLLFDVSSDQGVAKDVAAEAHRRFRADLRAKEERDSERRAADLALHEEKKKFVAEWIAVNGSEEQKARQAAGVLPMAEAVEAITEHVFACLGDRPRYTRDGAQRLRDHLAQLPEYGEVQVTAGDLVVSTEHAKMATATQWAVVNDLKWAFPDASIVLLRHRLGFRRDPAVPTIILIGVLATLKYGPFTLRREYLV
jgi:hypothetical protein